MKTLALIILAIALLIAAVVLDLRTATTPKVDIKNIVDYETLKEYNTADTCSYE